MTAPRGMPDGHRPGREAMEPTRLDHAADDRDRLRQQIAEDAARAVEAGSDMRRAVFRAARRVARSWVPDDRLPDAQEVRSEVHRGLDPSGSLRHLTGDAEKG